MKHILLFLLLALSASGQSVPSTYPYPRPLPTNGTVAPSTKISSTLTTTAYNDTKPAIWDVFVGGGYRSVKNLTEMTNINAYVRKQGMLTWNAENSHVYQLATNLTTWVDLGNPTSWSGGNTIYTADDSLVSNRAVNGAGYSLAFTNTVGYSYDGHYTNIDSTIGYYKTAIGSSDILPYLVESLNWGGLSIAQAASSSPAPNTPLGMLFMGDNSAAVFNPFRHHALSTLQLGQFGSYNPSYPEFSVLDMSVFEHQTLLWINDTDGGANSQLKLNASGAGLFVLNPSDDSIDNSLILGQHGTGLFIKTLPGGITDPVLNALLYDPITGSVQYSSHTNLEIGRNLGNANLNSAGVRTMSGTGSIPELWLRNYRVLNLGSSNYDTTLGATHSTVINGPYNLQINTPSASIGAVDYGQVLVAYGAGPIAGVEYSTLYWNALAQDAATGNWFADNTSFSTIYPGNQQTATITTGAIAYVVFNGYSVGGDTFKLGNDVAAPLYTADHIRIRPGDIMPTIQYTLIRKYGTGGAEGIWVIAASTRYDRGRTYIRSVSGDTTIDSGDSTIVVTATSVTITLRQSETIGALTVNMVGKSITVKNSNAVGSITVSSSVSIDGGGSVTIPALEARTFQFDGTNWWITSKF